MRTITPDDLNWVESVKIEEYTDGIGEEDRQVKSIFKLAAAFNVDPTELWPDLEVAGILDTVARFQQEQELTPEQADAIEKASKRKPSKTKGRRLPSRKEK